MALEAHIRRATLRLGMIRYVLLLFLDFGAYRFLEECSDSLGAGPVLALCLLVLVRFGQGLRSWR